MATSKKPPKRKPAAKPRNTTIVRDGLNVVELAFIDSYMVQGNGGKAAIDAGYAAVSARVRACALLKRPQVIAEIARRKEAMSKASGITAERVLQETFNILTANVNELVEFRRNCCRHCYGIEYGYQRTTAEYNADFRVHALRVAKNNRKKKDEREDIGEFDEQGGIGFDAHKPPNVDCQLCFGDGVGDAFFKDTRTLSPTALALYAGVKVSKEGTQMLLLDKGAAMERLFKHFGLYKSDNEQKNEGLAELFALIQSKKSRLPIKE